MAVGLYGSIPSGLLVVSLLPVRVLKSSHYFRTGRNLPPATLIHSAIQTTAAHCLSMVRVSVAFGGQLRCPRQHRHRHPCWKKAHVLFACIKTKDLRNLQRLVFIIFIIYFYIILCNISKINANIFQQFLKALCTLCYKRYIIFISQQFIRFTINYVIIQ